MAPAGADVSVVIDQIDGNSNGNSIGVPHTIAQKAIPAVSAGR